MPAGTPLRDLQPGEKIFFPTASGTTAESPTQPVEPATPETPGEQANNPTVRLSLSQVANNNPEAQSEATAAETATPDSNLTGLDFYDFLQGTDQVVAGFADAVTFGGTTQLRELLYGDLAARNHQQGLFSAGQVLLQSRG